MRKKTKYNNIKTSSNPLDNKINPNNDNLEINNTIDSLNRIIEDKKRENTVEDIYTKVLDKDIEKCINDYTSIYEQQLQLIDNFIKDIDNKHSKNKNDLLLQKQENDKELNLKRKELEDFLENEKNKLQKEHQEFLSNLQKEKKELEDNYNLKNKELEEEYISRQGFLDDYELELNKENNEKYNLLLEKLEKQKDEFNSFMDNQKELLKKEIEEKNKERLQEFNNLNEQLDIKRLDIEKYYDEKLKEFKKTELDLFKKDNEISEKAKLLNKNVEKFYSTKKKFVKRHYLLFIFANKFKKHKIKFCVTFFILLSLLIYNNYLFEYSLSKNTFISNSLAKQYNSSDYNNIYSITLDTSNSVLKDFKDLDNLNLQLNYSYNSKFLEDYKKFNINSSNEKFEFERFYKNNTMVMKSANDGQYIIVNDLNNSNYIYNKNEFNDIIYNSLKQYLSTLHNKDYINVNRINILSKNTFTDYIKDLILLSSNYEYYYEINHPSQKLFENIFKDFINSESYENFIVQESDIQTALDLQDNLYLSSTILENLVKFSKVNNTIVNVKILKGNIIGSVDIKFELLYKDDSMVSEIPINIRLSCIFNSLNNFDSLEKDNFTKNAIFIEDLKPRNSYNEFIEETSIPFKESSTSLKDLQQNLTK